MNMAYLFICSDLDLFHLQMMYKESYIILLLVYPIPTSALIQPFGDIKQESTVKAAQDNKIIFP